MLENGTERVSTVHAIELNENGNKVSLDSKLDSCLLLSKEATMCYTIAWGAPALQPGGPTWLPPGVGLFSRGQGFAPLPPPTARLRLFLDNGAFPPPLGLINRNYSGSYWVDIPFTINGPPGAVNVILVGGTDSRLIRFKTPSTRCRLLPSTFTIDAIIEIRTPAGAVLFNIPPANISNKQILFHAMNGALSTAGMNPICRLVAGVAYILHCELKISAILRVFRFGAMNPTQGVSISMDQLTFLNQGLWYDILLPPCPENPAEGIQTSSKLHVFPAQLGSQIIDCNKASTN